MPDSDPSHPATPRRRLTGLDPQELIVSALSRESSTESVAVPGYEIDIPIGSGGVGTVYLSRQLSLDRDVAIKVLSGELAGDPVFLERLAREAKTMAQLQHPNVVTVHHFHQADDGGAAIVMELVEGESLRELLHRYPDGLPIKEVIRVFRQICGGLTAAHAAQVVHRDMKPENVLLNREGTAQVTDFGLALPLERGSPRLTIQGTTAGTLDYMSPEQVGGESIDHRADIYALGVILYEMLTGQIPRGSFDPPHLVKSTVPHQVSLATMKALRPKAGERFETVNDFLKAVESGASNSTSGKSWIWIAIAMLAIGGIAAAVMLPKADDKMGPDVAVANAESWRDLLASFDMHNSMLSGNWKREEKALVSSGTVSMIMLREAMPDNYEFRTNFTRLSGHYSVSVFVSYRGELVSCSIDGWGGDLAGVQQIGDEDLRDGYGMNFELENGVPHELFVRVAPPIIHMEIDGEHKMTFEIGDTDVSLPEPWEWDRIHYRGEVALALATYQSPTRFDKIEWRPLK